MKIGLVCPYNMLEHSGGVQEIVKKLAHDLRAKNHNVKVITPRPIGHVGDPPAGIIFLGRSKRLNGTLSTVLDFGIEVDGDEINKVLDEEKFDVINFHEPWYPVLPRQIAMRSQSSAHVGTFHAILPDTMTAKSVVSLLTPYGRSITERMHLLTATSPSATKVLFSKSTGKNIHQSLLENIKYIPVAVDLEFFKPFKRHQPLNGKGTQTVVFVGRLDKRKGVEWLVKAFALLVAEMPNVHLMIAGSGEKLKSLQKEVKDGKIPNVKFLGRVTDEEKRRLIGNADLTCYPSVYGEGFGIVLLESMAMGNFPITGNNAGFRNVMKGDGLVGLVTPEATEDFANRLKVFLTSTKLHKIMNDWALQEVKQYDFRTMVSNYETAYKEALDIFRKSNRTEGAQIEKSKRKAFGWLSVRRHA